VIRSLILPKVYVPLLVLVALLLMPSWASRTQLNIAVLVLLFVILAQAWNIIGGYGNSLSLGHAAFFAMGAYGSTLLLVRYDVTPLIGLWLGVLLALMLAALVGWATLRLRGAYFAIATLAVVVLMQLLVLTFRDFTGGAQGVRIPFLGVDPLYLQFVGDAPYYYIVLFFAGLATYLIYRLEHSQLGYRLRATGQDETAAQAIGINTPWVKLKALFLSAAITALGGTLYVQYVYLIDPFYVVSVQFSILIAIPAILGGVSTVWGPVAGAVLLIPIDQYTQRLLGGTQAGAQLIVYGLILLLVIRYRPNGIIEWVERGYKWLLRRLPGGARQVQEAEEAKKERDGAEGYDEESEGRRGEDLV
jgi:branched-chain amino acid transport system permease protein